MTSYQDDRGLGSAPSFQRTASALLGPHGNPQLGGGPASSAFLSQPSSGAAGTSVQPTQTQPQQQAVVTFDEFGKVRVLEASQYDASQRLKEECKEFTQRIGDFNSIVCNFLDVVNNKARQIESKKLQAVGQRNHVEHETEDRKSRQARLKALIKEAQSEMDRLTAHLESVQKVEAEQQAFIDGLFNK